MAKTKKDSPRCRKPGTSLTERQYEILSILEKAEKSGHYAHVMEVYDNLANRASYPALISSLNALERKGLMVRGAKVNRSTKVGNEKGVPKSCRELQMTEKGRMAMPAERLVTYDQEMPQDFMDNLDV